MEINGGRLVAMALKREGIERIFGLIGYHITHIFDGCHREGIIINDVRHEQAAVHMADAWAQVKGKPAVASVIGGPGFTNAISAVLKAQTSNTPILVITGAADPAKKDLGAMQEIDHWEMVKAHVKWAVAVPTVKRIPEYISKALHKAVNGKPGVVVLAIPVNILSERVNTDEIMWPDPEASVRKIIYPDPTDISRAVERLKTSERPIIIAGSGIMYANAMRELSDFVEKSGIPVYTINGGRGTIPDDHPLCFGLGRPLEGGPQLHGFYRADTVVVLGVKLNFTMGYGLPPIFHEDQIFIQADIDHEEIGRGGRQAQVAIVGDLKISLTMLKEKLEYTKLPSFEKWVEELRKEERRFWDVFARTYDKKVEDKINPFELIKAIQQVLPKDAISVIDGSNALFWGLLLLKCNEPGHQIIAPSGILGQMGPGLPQALGVKIAKPDKTVLLYTGDGSLGFNLAEFDTAIRLNLPVLIVVHNDGAWGLPKDTQKRLFGENYSVDLGITRYDKVMESLGGYGEMVSKIEDVIPALKRALDSGKPSCVNVIVDETLISPGAKLLSIIETGIKCGSHGKRSQLKTV